MGEYVNTQFQETPLSETFTIARYAASTSLQDIPEAVRERTKQVIFDEMACAYFGRSSIAGDLANKYARASGGAGPCSILGTSHSTNVAYAALANGAAGHGDEVDGTHVVGGHPGSSLVHTAVAMAQHQRSNGADLINAVALGYDVSVRIIQACGEQFAIRDRFKLHSDFIYGLGSASVASRLLGLDAERHSHALALATFQTNSLWALFSEERHISKSLCNGQFAFAGVSAALMAAAGLEGHTDILGAPFGVLDAWGDKDRRKDLTASLGESFAIMGANFKFQNCGYPIHAAIEAGLDLVAKHGLHVDSIDTVDVGMPTNAMKVVDNRTMHNICLQDMLSAALVRGSASLRHHPFPEILSEPAFQRIRPRVHLRGDADFDRELPDGRGAIVRITSSTGHTFSSRVDWPRGHSKRGPVSWDDLSSKWHEALPQCDVHRMVEMARKLEDLHDVNTFVALFSAH